MKMETVVSLFEKIISSHPTAYQLQAMDYMLTRFPALISQLGPCFMSLVDACTFTEQEEEEEEIESHSPALKGCFMYTRKCQNLCLELLLKRGLAVDMLDAQGQTLLHLAAGYCVDEYENVFYLRCLLDLGYPVDLRNTRSQTPLCVALQAGLQAHAFYLISRGANVFAADFDAKRPLDYVRNFCSLGQDQDCPYNLEAKQQIIQVLKDYGVRMFKTGVYDLIGSNDFSGTRNYHGEVTIVPHGINYRIDWAIEHSQTSNGQTQTGIGILNDTVLSVAYHDSSSLSTGVVSYYILEEGNLSGSWATCNGKIQGIESLVWKREV